jgi:hypothetical protein
MNNPERNEQTVADLARGYTRYLAHVYGEDPLPPVNVCEGCGTSSGNIEAIWTDDGNQPVLCEDCGQAVRRLERLADELAAAPCCPDRQRIVDTAETTADLVSRFQAHDLSECEACARVAAEGRDVPTDCETKVA